MTALNCFNEYKTKALRTMPADTFLKQALHCAMGMAGEAGEYKELLYMEPEQRIGEIGDCMWYAAVFSDVLSLDLNHMVSEAEKLNRQLDCPFVYHTSGDRALIWACRLVDLVKKSVFYGRELDRAAAESILTHYWAALLSMCSDVPAQPLSVAHINLLKLEARYPGKVFNADHANNRDYAAESAAAGVKIV